MLRRAHVDPVAVQLKSNFLLATRNEEAFERNRDRVEVRFQRLIADHLVVQEVDFESPDPAFAGTMTMSWKLSTVTNGTDVTVTAENVPDGIRPVDHEAAMHSSLANLAAFVE